MTPEILARTTDYAAVVKPVGMDSETEMPVWIKEQTGTNAYCVHRLDKNVGGVMVYALNPKAAAALSGQVTQNLLKKEYLCIYSGSMEEKAGQLHDFLLKDNAKKKAFPVKSIRKGVKEAALEYKELATADFDGGVCSLSQVLLKTGRYHQIRVQFASRRHPLFGDGKYGSRVKGKTPALWSFRITFKDPASGEKVRIIKMPPAEFPWNLFEPAGLVMEDINETDL